MTSKSDMNITGASRVRRANPLEIRRSADIEQPMAAVSKQTATRKPGRPKVRTEDYKKVNIAIPVSVLERVDIAKESYHGNLTEYINTLICRDLSLNMDDYKKTYDMLNKLGRV